MRLPPPLDAAPSSATADGLKPLPPRGGPFSFGLRTLMLVVLLFGSVTGWTRSLITSAHAQRAAVLTFRNAGYRQPCFPGCETFYRNSRELDAANEPGWRAWLGERFGHDYFRDVVYLDLAGSKGKPSFADPLKPLEGFPRLEHLQLQACGTTDADLSRVGGCTHLRELIIIAAPMTDAGLAHLVGLKGLRRLRVNRCQITDAGLAHLAALTSLERLDIVCVRGRVTADGLAKLQRVLPSLRITLNSKSLSVAPDPPEPTE